MVSNKEYYQKNKDKWKKYYKYKKKNLSELERLGRDEKGRFVMAHKIGHNQNHTEETKEKLRGLAKKGECNNLWTGGKPKPRYKLITLPNGKQKGEHRLVMENKLNRCLTNKEVVHHINGDGRDNRIENLILFANNGEHKKHHLERFGF